MSLALQVPSRSTFIRATTRTVRGQLDMTLSVEVAHLRTVRRIVRAHLRLWEVDETVVDSVLVAVNELLTNVYQHTLPDPSGCRRASLLVQHVPDGVTVVVRDDEMRPPVRTAPALMDETGRGLQIVRELADDFSVSVTDAGKDVWVYIAEPQATP